MSLVRISGAISFSIWETIFGITGILSSDNSARYYPPVPELRGCLQLNPGLERPIRRASGTICNKVRGGLIPFPIATGSWGKYSPAEGTHQEGNFQPGYCI